MHQGPVLRQEVRIDKRSSSSQQCWFEEQGGMQLYNVLFWYCITRKGWEYPGMEIIPRKPFPSGHTAQVKQKKSLTAILMEDRLVSWLESPDKAENHTTQDPWENKHTDSSIPYGVNMRSVEQAPTKKTLCHSHSLIYVEQIIPLCDGQTPVLACCQFAQRVL